MDTLDRFLIREFFQYFLLTLAGMAVLFLGIDFLANLWRTDLPMIKVLEIYLYKIPGALQQFIPLTSLLATLLVLSNMSRQNEVLALYTSGVGTFRIISTFIALVATVSTFSFLAFDTLVPSMTKKQIMIRKGLNPYEEHALFKLRTGLWYRSKNLIYNVGRFVPETNVLEDVNIYVLSPSFEITEIIHAKKAIFENEDWTLKEGVFVTNDPKTRFSFSESFETKKGIIPEKPSDFKTLQIDETTMQLKALRKYIHRNRNFGLDTIQQQVHYHERVALVFAPLVFILLGIPFALKPLRTHSMAKSIGLCFFIVFLYLLVFRMSLSIGKGGHIPAVAAAWAPNTIFFTLALIFSVRKK